MGNTRPPSLTDVDDGWSLLIPAQHHQHQSSIPQPVSPVADGRPWSRFRGSWTGIDAAVVPHRASCLGVYSVKQSVAQHQAICCRLATEMARTQGTGVSKPPGGSVRALAAEGLHSAFSVRLVGGAGVKVGATVEASRTQDYRTSASSGP